MEEKKEDEIIVEIYADKIIEPHDPMRTTFDRDKIHELAESIKQQGLINPITVRPVGDKYEIVAGHRRFKACLIAGKAKIPSVIRTMTDQEVLTLRAHENLYRDDVDPVDEALYIQKIIGTDDTKIPELARLLNRSEQWMWDRLALLSYPDYFLPALKAGTIKLGVAKALAAIEDEAYRQMFFDNAIRDGMTVYQAEYYLAQWQGGVFKEGSEIIPPSTPENPTAKTVVKMRCAKCGEQGPLEDMTNVFIHFTCPEDVPPPSEPVKS